MVERLVSSKSHCNSSPKWVVQFEPSFVFNGEFVTAPNFDGRAIVSAHIFT